MAVSEAHKMASYKYNASRDSITIRPERSKGAAIRAAAAASGTRAGCPVRVDQVQPEPVPDGPGPDQHREGPAPPRSAAEMKKPE